MLYNSEIFLGRAAKLSGGVAAIKVGTATETVMKGNKPASKMRGALLRQRINSNQ